MRLRTTSLSCMVCDAEQAYNAVWEKMGAPNKAHFGHTTILVSILAMLLSGTPYSYALYGNQVR